MLTYRFLSMGQHARKQRSQEYSLEEGGFSSESYSDLFILIVKDEDYMEPTFRHRGALRIYHLKFNYTQECNPNNGK